MSSGVLGSVRTFASLVRLSHSVFALPFAVLALLVATQGRPAPALLGLVVLAVVAARTAAMAYNRLVDRDIDAENPRTAGRELPRGALSPRAVTALVAGAAAVFLVACWQLGPWCRWGAVPVLLWLLGYSHVKRFSALCHLWLGTALGLAPVAAWVAAGDWGATTAAGGGVDAGRLWIPIVLGLGVTAWVAGFDVLYACQDAGFDRGRGLHSIPAKLGQRRALWLARLLHVGALGLFVSFGLAADLRGFYLAGAGLAAGLLWWQHRALDPARLDRIGPGLFTSNGALSVVMLAAGAADLY